MKSVVFSGHRDVIVEHGGLIEKRTKEYCEVADHLFVGGAKGADFIVLMTACDVAELDKKRTPEVWLVVPSRLVDQPQVTHVAAERARKVFSERFHLIEMMKPYNGESLKARNREMIDRAIKLGDPELFVYFRGIFKSGTFSAMCYAKKMGVAIEEISLT